MGVFFGEGFDASRVGGGLVRHCGEGLDFGEEGLAFFFAHVAQAGHEEGEEGEDGELAGEGFGGADADFRAGAEEKGAVGFAGEGGIADVADAEDFGAFAFDFAHGGDGVEGFARLADGDDEGVFGDDRVFIAEFRGDFCLGRDAGFVFEKGGGDQAGMPGSSAGEDEDAADGEEVGRGEGEVFKFGGAKIGDEAVVEGLLDGLGLLEDFFEHEMGIAVFGDGDCGRMLSRSVFFCDGGAALVEDFDFIGADHERSHHCAGT